MLLDDGLFEKEWFGDLPLRLRMLYIVLLSASSKTGVFEANLRRLSFVLNDGSAVTEDDVFGPQWEGRIRRLGRSRGIFPDYVAWNWYRGKPLNPWKNPLHRGVWQELMKNGLDFRALNAMARRKVSWVDEEGVVHEGDERNECAGAVAVPAVGAHDGDGAAAAGGGVRPAPCVEPVAADRPAGGVRDAVGVGEVKAECERRGNGIDPERFVRWYEERGWPSRVGGPAGWRTLLSEWEARDRREAVNARGDNGAAAPRRPVNAVQTGGAADVAAYF